MTEMTTVVIDIVTLAERVKQAGEAVRTAHAARQSVRAAYQVADDALTQAYADRQKAEYDLLLAAGGEAPVSP